MTKTIVANFKMNGSREFISTYFEHLVAATNNTVVICPPFPYLDQVNQCLSQRSFANVYLGAQNCYGEVSGAFTGETSASMLADIGCQYVILGHSERRLLRSETSEVVRQKVFQAWQANLIPIICVGESLQQRQEGIAKQLISSQLKASIPEKISPQHAYLIAYEPIWAIGTGLTAIQNDIETMHQFIRSHPMGKNVPILYGGSVNGDNAQHILSYKNVDGVLVGGASLKIHEFNRIISR